MKNKIDFQKTLRDAASLMGRLKRPERLLKMITRFIDRHFGLSHTSFALLDESKNRFVFVDSKGHGRLPLSLVRLDQDHPIVQIFQRDKSKFLKTILKSSCLHRSDLAKSVIQGRGAEKNEDAVKLLKAMDFLKAELVIPGYDKQKLTGLLLLGQKKSRRFFTLEEISFFQILVQNCSMAAKISQKSREVQKQADEMEKFRKKENNTYYEIMRCLAQEVHAKDPYTFGHIHQVERLGMMTAREMGLELAGKKKDVLSAGLILHDVGKIGIPDSILKKQARLDDEEWKVMRTHAEKGAKILEELSDFKEVAEIVHSHHEYFDGKGYPRGLKGEQIPIEARIISVVDAFHAMVSTRCYSKGRPVETAFEELERCSGSQFDPGVVSAFTRALKREMKKRGVGFFIEETAGAAA